MNTIVRRLLFVVLLFVVGNAFADTLAAGSFVTKQKSIVGSWTIETEGEDRVLKFSEDFKTRSGPDLKVFLSPTAFGSVNGRNAVKGSVQLAVLKQTKGTQSYKIPSSIDLSAFKSLLVHCEKYSVLWGGSSL